VLPDLVLAHRFSPLHWGRSAASPATFIGFVLRLTIPLLVVLVACSASSAKEGLLGPSRLEDDVAEFLGRAVDPSGVSVPFLRDYSFIAILVLTCLSFAQLSSQWERLERLPKQVERAGLFMTEDLELDRIAEEFSRLSRRANAALLDLASALIALVFTAVVVFIVLRGSIYPFLDQASLGADQSHTDQWWANPSNSVASFILYSSVGVLFFYLHVRNTILGAQIALLLRNLHRVSDAAGASAWFGYSGRWADPTDGVAAIRRTMLDAFLAIGYGLSVGAFAVYAFSAQPIVLVFIIGWGVWDVAILLLPWVVLNRQLRSSKQRLESGLLAEIRSIASPDEEIEFERGEWLWRAYTHAMSLPERVLNRGPVTGFVAFYLLPIVGIIQGFRS
jgi:hypothetical protein